MHATRFATPPLRRNPSQPNGGYFSKPVDRPGVHNPPLRLRPRAAEIIGYPQKPTLLLTPSCAGPLGNCTWDEVGESDGR